MEFDRQYEITKLLLEGINSTHVSHIFSFLCHSTHAKYDNIKEWIGMQCEQATRIAMDREN